MQMNEKNEILWKIKDFSWQNMCFLYFVASNQCQQSLKPKFSLNLGFKRFELCVQTLRIVRELLECSRTLVRVHSYK